MRIYINAKQIKKRGAAVASVPYELNSIPHTLRELITMLVLDGVRDYHHRIENKEQVPVLSAEEMESMAQIGKIGFGIPFGSAPADAGEAVEAALQGYTDGLIRIFLNEEETGGLDEPLTLREGDELTILRLVMLTGGFFR